MGQQRKDGAVILDDAEVIRETFTNGSGALLVEHEDFLGGMWIPKRAVHDDSELYGTYGDSEPEFGPGMLVIKEWFATAELGYK